MIDAAIDQGVRRVLALSTDKAVNPINLYGATKLCAEKMFVQANAYAGAQDTRFSCARYGNVVGSRGSVIPVFLEQRKRGKITVTDSAHDSLLAHARAGSAFRRGVHRAHAWRRNFRAQDSQHAADGYGGEPSLLAVKWNDGIRPGEKLHEVLVSEDEARNTLEVEDMYVIQPAHPWWSQQNWNDAKALPDGFRYGSDSNEHWLSSEELQALIETEIPASEKLRVVRPKRARA